MLLEERVARPTTEAEAVKIARDLYGLAVTAKSLPGEYDEIFHLRALRENIPDTKEEAAAAGFVLKVMPPGGEGSLTDMQCCACSAWRSTRHSLRCRACGSTETARHLQQFPRRMD